MSKSDVVVQSAESVVRIMLRVIRAKQALWNQRALIDPALENVPFHAVRDHWNAEQNELRRLFHCGHSHIEISQYVQLVDAFMQVWASDHERDPNAGRMLAAVNRIRAGNLIFLPERPKGVKPVESAAPALTPRQIAARKGAETRKRNREAAAAAAA